MRPLSVLLGPGPTPEELVRRADGWPGLVCLRGDWAGGTPILTSHPLDVRTSLDPVPVVAGPEHFVGGGWFGWLGFDGASRLAWHDHVLRLVDRQWHFEALWSGERDTALTARLGAWTELLRGPDVRPDWTVGEFDGPPAVDHLAAVERAIELIRAGELYQVNVCTRLGAAFEGSPVGLFAAAGELLDPAFGALLAGEGRALVSMSPELFLRRRGADVVSSPIKGTLPRDVPGNDTALRRSTKDVAENVMIVDLVRNDLGRVCETGTVRVTALLDVQAHPGVWHLVSTVEGRLRAQFEDADLLRAAFPPGSVTGAPKLRALRAIADLEPVPRGAYTGAIGFVSPCWGAELSVAIRTFEITEGRIELGVGGGITADSVPMLEWRECLHKAAPLLSAADTRLAVARNTPAVLPTAAQRAGGLLETILGVDGVPLRLADHLARLDRSARELYGTGGPDDLADRVRAVAASVPAGRAVLRVVLFPDLTVDVTAQPAGPPPVATDLVVTERPAGLWRHKWAQRSWAAQAEVAGGVPLFVAADGTVLETSRGNVFLIESDETLVTAPLRDDLLPGVTRRAVLDLARDEGRATELRGFGLSELTAHAAF
ncbi:MAG TPA: aminodeoxychorismate synthase component I, partial [Jatrophihabitans sp.]|nr:aminodeoxychorismate synthase component I [Jatrophihabitans sp.]